MSDDAKRDDLASGMTVLTRERDYADVTAISISVRGGSRNEHDDTVGAAHFMEHMFFQGTPSRPTSDAVFGPISARGGWLNAYTSFENINFQAVVKNEDFGLALDTLADMLVNSLFAEDRIDKERQVVLEELIRGRNDPRRYAVELFFKSVWDEHPARNLPIGSRETLANSGRQVLMAIPAAKSRRIEETIPGSQAQIVLGLPAPGADHPDTYALDILSATLGEVGRRLIGEIRDRRGLASSVGSSYSTLSDVGCWWAMVGTSPSNVEQVIELITEQMRRIRSEPLAPSELADAKSYI